MLVKRNAEKDDDNDKNTFDKKNITYPLILGILFRDIELSL